MRPIWRGVIFFVIGALGWVVGVIFSAVTLGKLAVLPNIFGVMMILSLPVALIAEFVHRKHKK